ncbi:MAG: hypothetical protein PVJ64_00350 [Gemmatimonadales bacterium]|jgi:hypothetical protein
MDLLRLLWLVLELAWSDPIVERALTECPTNRRPDRAVVIELFRLEIEAGVPRAVRGLLVAAACAESGYRAAPRGHSDGGRARGMFQFWSWARSAIRRHGATTEDPRDDWRASARFWLEHVQRMLPRVRRDCEGRRGYPSHEIARWAAANLTAVSAPLRDARGRFRARCARARRHETRHLRLLRAWRGWPRTRGTARAPTGR